MWHGVTLPLTSLPRRCTLKNIYMARDFHRTITIRKLCQCCKSTTTSSIVEENITVCLHYKCVSKSDANTEHYDLEPDIMAAYSH